MDICFWSESQRSLEWPFYIRGQDAHLPMTTPRRSDKQQADIAYKTDDHSD